MQTKPTIHIQILAALLLLSFSLNAQSNVFGGKAIDASTGEPLIGANVLIDGTNNGAATDVNGEFKLFNTPKEDFIILISMIGYQSFSLKITENLRSQGYAEFELKPALIEMGSVVVTGTNSTHLYEDVPVKTELVTKKLIRQQAACNLSQALGLQTGVMVENNCNNCNFTQVRILGFDGKYSQVLIDGDPVVSSLGGVYGLEHYPQEMIEQIEIVKGGGSSLYGGGAVAGTINLMTRRPAFNSTRVSYSGSSAEGSYDQQLGAVAEMVNKDNTAGLFIFGSTRNRSAYDRNGDGFTELGMLKNETFGVNSYFRPFSGGELRLDFHRISEDRRGGNDLEKPVHEARISEWTDHLKWGGKLRWEQTLGQRLSYKIHYAFSYLERDSYYGGLAEDTPEARLEALNYYGYSRNPLHTYGAQANYSLKDHRITAGFQQTFDDLLDESVSSDAYYLNEQFRNTGIFFQDELKFGNDLAVVAGVRFDKHSAIEDWILSPRINAKYQLTHSLKIRGGYTTGFKAPQIFDEDLHICGLEGTQRVIRNAEGLQEERSSSYSLGFEFLDFVKGIPVLFGVTSFYTTLDNAYSDVFISSDGNIEVWERVNSRGADVMGVEVDLGVKPVSSFEIRSGLTFKENKYKDNHADYPTKNFLRTPDMFGYVRGTYDIKSGISLFASLKYTGSMYIPHEILAHADAEPELVLKQSSSFFELDAAASKLISFSETIKTNISVGIKNIFNSYQTDLDYGVLRDPAYVYGPSQPRTVYFSLDLSL